MATDKLKLPKKSFKKGDLPDNLTDWVKYINSHHDVGLEARRRYEIQWAVNMAYVKGYQNLLYDPVSGLFHITREAVQPIVVNRIAAFVEARHAKLLKNRPISRVLPNTPDRADQNGAKNADLALTHLFRKIGMPEVRDRLITQMLIYGNSFELSVWDPDAGDEFEDTVYEDGIIEMTEDLTDFQTEKIFLGDVSTKVKSPFQVIPANQYIPKVCDQPWLILRDHMPLADVYKKWPHLEGKIKGDDKQTNKTEFEKAVNRLSSPTFSAYGYEASKQMADTLGGEVLVKTFMMKPNTQYENGLIMTVIQNEVGSVSEFPDDYGSNIYPLVKYTEKEDGESFWQQSTVERLIPVQKAINIIKQKKIKNITLMANGKWMVPKGSQISEEAITDEEGEVIEYNPAVPMPQQAGIAPLPNYVQQTEQDLITDFRDVGGQRETTFAPSSNLTAGVAMQVQAELTDEIMNPIIARVARSMEATANIQLLLMDQNYTEPRQIKILGEKGRIGVQWMKNTDFRHNTDVHIEIESMFPDFRGAKQQRLFDMWDRRIITDPTRFLEVLRTGNLDLLMEEAEEAKDNVWLDIQRIKNGKEPEIYQEQNHLLYAAELIKWMNTPDFLRLIPERKDLALQVAQAHLQFVMQQMPNQGEPMEQQNQNSVGTPFGPVNPVQ